MVHRPLFPTASLSDMDCTVNFKRETSCGDRVAVIATVPLSPWMGYVWEIKEDGNADNEKGNRTKNRKRRRKKKISTDRMDWPIMWGSLNKEISNERR